MAAGYDIGASASASSGAGIGGDINLTGGGGKQFTVFLIVGGVVAVAIVAGLLFFLTRKK